MPADSDTAPRPSEGRDLEARLRAELGVGSVPRRERERHLTVLQDLAVSSGPARCDTAGSDETAARRVTAPDHKRRTPRSLSRSRPTASAAPQARRQTLTPVRSRLLAACLVLLVAVAGSGVTIAGAQGAVPGELLYPVKLGAERVALVAASSEADLVERHLDFAERRLDEAAALLEGEGDLDRLGGVLERHRDELDAAFARAGEAPALEHMVEAAAGTAAARLDELAREVPDSSAPAIERMVERAHDRIEERVPSLDAGGSEVDDLETGPGAAPPERAPGAPPDPEGSATPDRSESGQPGARDPGAPDDASDAADRPASESPTDDVLTDPDPDDASSRDAGDGSRDDAAEEDGAAGQSPEDAGARDNAGDPGTDTDGAEGAHDPEDSQDGGDGHEGTSGADQAGESDGSAESRSEGSDDSRTGDPDAGTNQGDDRP